MVNFVGEMKTKQVLMQTKLSFSITFKHRDVQIIMVPLVQLCILGLTEIMEEEIY